MAKENNQFSLFGDLDNFILWKQEWKNMPEFIQENLEPWKTIEIIFKGYFDKKGYWIAKRIIKVHFENLEDIKEFARRINISGITFETKQLLYQKSVDKFAELTEQKITETTGYLWFPEVKAEKVIDKRWVSHCPECEHYVQGCVLDTCIIK